MRSSTSFAEKQIGFEFICRTCSVESVLAKQTQRQWRHHTSKFGKKKDAPPRTTACSPHAACPQPACRMPAARMPHTTNNHLAPRVVVADASLVLALAA
jgi:hypothetical protein